MRWAETMFYEPTTFFNVLTELISFNFNFRQRVKCSNGWILFVGLWHRCACACAVHVCVCLNETRIAFCYVCQVLLQQSCLLQAPTAVRFNEKWRESNSEQRHEMNLLHRIETRAIARSIQVLQTMVKEAKIPIQKMGHLLGFKSLLAWNFSMEFLIFTQIENHKLQSVLAQQSY